MSDFKTETLGETGPIPAPEIAERIKRALKAFGFDFDNLPADAPRIEYNPDPRFLPCAFILVSVPNPDSEHSRVFASYLGNLISWASGITSVPLALEAELAALRDNLSELLIARALRSIEKASE